MLYKFTKENKFEVYESHKLKKALATKVENFSKIQSNVDLMRWITQYYPDLNTKICGFIRDLRFKILIFRKSLCYVVLDQNIIVFLFQLISKKPKNIVYKYFKQKI